MLPSWRLKRFFDTKSKMPRTCQTQHKDCSGSPAPLSSLSPPLLAFPLQFSMPSGALSLLVQPISCAGIWQSDLCHVHAQHVKCEIQAGALHLPPLSISTPCPTLIEIFANANIFQVVHKYLCNLLRIQLMLIFVQCTRIFFWHTKCATNASSSAFD